MALTETSPDPEIQEPDEFVGVIPSKIGRWGIGLLISILIVSIVTLIIILYPTHIRGTMTITHEQSVIPLAARSEGFLAFCTASNGDTVRAGQILCILESSSDPIEVLQMDSLLAILMIEQTDLETTSRSIAEHPFTNLGNLSRPYANLITAAEEYLSYLQNNSSYTRIASYATQRNDLEKILEDQNQLMVLLRQEVDLKKVSLERNVYLRDTGVFTQVDYEKSKSLLIAAEGDYQKVLLAIRQGEKEINQTSGLIDTEVRESKLSLAQKENGLREAIISLFGMVEEWEFNYAIIAPTEGQVAINPGIITNRYIKKDQTVMSLLPLTPGSLIGTMVLPIKGAARITVGQKVLIRLNEYPYLQFGILKGYIEELSPVPINGNYLARVTFPDSNNALLGKTIQLNRLLTGEGRVVVRW